MIGDKPLARTSAEALIADERAKNHHVLAEQLSNALFSSKNNGSPSQKTMAGFDGSQNGTRARDLFIEITPKRRIDDLFLNETTRSLCLALVEEQRRADLLRSHAIEPRHKILLSGPPGNGKTTLAESIAEALAIPLLAVRYDAVIGSFLGETASRLRRAFDLARSIPCVLFFDEFDVIGKERGDTNETGEIKRVVSSLLLQIDDLPSSTVVIAATNHAELLDRAVWRRFQLRIDLPYPTAEQTHEFILSFFRSRSIREPIRNSEEIASSLHPASFSEIEDFCTNVLRRHILALGASRLNTSVQTELKYWRSRTSPTKLSGEHP